MKRKTLGAALCALVASAALLLAADPNMGTWKLNEGKSKLSPGATKNNMVVYAAAGDSVKITVDGVDADGKKVHHEWTGKYDGKDYAVTGDPTSDTRAYTKGADANTMTFVAKKGGKVTVNGKVVVAADGKSRTVSAEGVNAKGEKVSSSAVYDKQ